MSNLFLRPPMCTKYCLRFSLGHSDLSGRISTRYYGSAGRGCAEEGITISEEALLAIARVQKAADAESALDQLSFSG